MPSNAFKSEEYFAKTMKIGEGGRAPPATPAENYNGGGADLEVHFFAA